MLLACMGLVQAKCQYKDVTTKSGKTYRKYETAATTRDQANGWHFLPTKDVCEATLIRDWTVPGSDKTLPYYMTTDVDTGSVKRAVIVVAGKNRDSWSYFNLMRNARNLAGATQGIDTRQVAIFSPVFLTKADKHAGSASGSDAYWKGDNWSSGEEAVSGNLNSFKALDELINHLAQRYPSIQQFVFAGHSMGAQLINRYSTMRGSNAAEPRPISYFIGNPGSWIWLSHDRPGKVPDKCSNYDKYKYGLAGNIPEYAKPDFDASGRKGVVDRIKRRNIHVLVGEKDYGPGDPRCQALPQGANHRERGTNYVKAMEKLNGGSLPASWTFDVVPGCTHDDWCMFHKKISLKYLFIDNHGGHRKRKGSSRGGKAHGHHQGGH